MGTENKTRNIEALLEIADHQAKLDLLATLRAPAAGLVSVLKQRVDQLATNPVLRRVVELGPNTEFGSW